MAIGMDKINTLSGRTVEYALGHSERELDRLGFQGKLLAPFTRQLFSQAGLGPGMHVLDVGCGSGDVSFVAADLVGERGHTIGVDRSAAALHRAKARALRRNCSNLTFVEGDPALMQFDQQFDAIVGRFVLMYQTDPVESLRQLARHLRPGGLMVFQELDTTACRSFPRAPSYDRAASWLTDALRGTGAWPKLGLQLHSVFTDSGLPAPLMRMDAIVSGDAEGPACVLLAEAVRSLLPTLEKLNIALPEEVDVDNLTNRIREEVAARRSAVVSYGLIGAWSRKAPVRLAS